MVILLCDAERHKVSKNNQCDKNQHVLENSPGRSGASCRTSARPLRQQTKNDKFRETRARPVAAAESHTAGLQAVRRRTPTYGGLQGELDQLGQGEPLQVVQREWFPVGLNTLRE